MDTDVTGRALIDKIIRIKQEMGSDLLILTHHYQRKDIVDLGHHRGDALSLALRAARDKTAKYIVFCGVHFMAQSAAILAEENQVVQIPDENAGYWMADIADPVKVETAWKAVCDLLGSQAVTPISFMNCPTPVKALCGRSQGIVCTASNAPKAFEWAFSRREKIFCFPDENLGRNTAMALDVPPDQILAWDPEKPLGGHTRESLEKAKVFLWKGQCQVHHRFTPEQIHTIRSNTPGAKVLVHPKCSREVVQLADACGSTSFIARYVSEAPARTTIAIATEINLIKRLAAEHPDKKILSLADAFCPNMYRINLKNLLHTLENLGKFNVVTVEPEIKKEALIALENMLNL